MAISKELLDKLGDHDLALACDRASVNIKILVASWDGLAPSEEEALLSPLRATLLSVTEVRMIFHEQLAGMRAGKLVEDALLEQVRETMGKVPEALKVDMGRALFDEAISILSIDKILSGQEREVILDELVPYLFVSKEDATAILDTIASDLKAKETSAES